MQQLVLKYPEELHGCHSSWHAESVLLGSHCLSDPSLTRQEASVFTRLEVYTHIGVRVTRLYPFRVEWMQFTTLMMQYKYHQKIEVGGEDRLFFSVYDIKCLE
ncbi:hypothetical protein ACN47E_002297 [Coniothyrium glycines]